MITLAAHRQVWARLLAGLALSAMAGCAVAPLEATTALKGDEGVVIVRVAANMQPTGEAVDQWTSLKVHSVERGAYLSLRRREYGNYSTGVFTGSLSPGRYTFEDLQATMGSMTVTANLRDLIPAFEVKGGEVTMLGTIVYQPTTPNHMRYVIGLIDPSEEDRSRVAIDFPDIARQMGNKSSPGFLAGPQLEARRQVGVMAKRSSAAINSIYQAEPGDFYAGSRMGVVLVKRHDQRRWAAYDTRSTREMLAVIPYKGSLLAAGEEGRLVQSTDGGASWSSLISPDTSSTIIALQQGPDGSLFALCRRDKDLALYRSEGIGQEWKSVAAFQEERAILNKVARIQVLAAGGTMYVLMPGALYSIDLASSRAVRHPHSLSCHNAGALAEGFLYCWGVEAMLTSIYLSEDGGKTWRDAKVSRFMRSPAFANRQTGYAVGARDPGLFPGEFAIAATKDGGATWKPSGRLPITVTIERELHVDRQDGSLLFISRSGTVFRTRDAGETWVQER